MEFEWDETKELKNIAKHGISFARSVETFRDPHGLKIRDSAHSDTEPRFLWVGRDSNGAVLTTRFTLRGKKIRTIGCGEWRKYRSIYYEKEE